MSIDSTPDSRVLPALLARVGGDAALASAMASLFLEEYPRHLESVRAAVAARDSSAIADAAHALRGSVSNFTLAAPAQAAARLEQLGRAGDLAEAPAALRELEGEIAHLVPVLREVIS